MFVLLTDVLIPGLKEIDNKDVCASYGYQIRLEVRRKKALDKKEDTVKSLYKGRSTLTDLHSFMYEASLGETVYTINVL